MTNVYNLQQYDIQTNLPKQGHRIADLLAKGVYINTDEGLAYGNGVASSCRNWSYHS
jgi:hypothetical protein